MDENGTEGADRMGADLVGADLVGADLTGADLTGVGALGRFLTLADTAEILNISAGQAYALVRSGELPAIKIGAGGHWRVERMVLETYIQAMYEESRRMSLWNQSDFGNVTEFSRG